MSMNYLTALGCVDKVSSHSPFYWRGLKAYKKAQRINGEATGAPALGRPLTCHEIKIVNSPRWNWCNDIYSNCIKLIKIWKEKVKALNINDLSNENSCNLY